MTTTDHVTQVVGAVISHHGRILAARRLAEADQEAGWEFPGGKVKPGETPQAALTREIREELGVTIAVGELVARATTAIPGAEIDLACYRATALDTLPSASRSHDRLRWVAPKDLGSVAWLAPDRPTVRALMAWGASSPSLTTVVYPEDPWHRVWPKPI